MQHLTKLLLDRQTALWNAVIPKRAARFEFEATHVRYLHPTKVWRTVANRRLGL